MKSVLLPCCHLAKHTEIAAIPPDVGAALFPRLTLIINTPFCQTDFFFFKVVLQKMTINVPCNLIT